MKKSWTTGLEPDAAKEIKMHYTSALQLRKRMKELLRKKEDENYSKNISSSDYDNPNWCYKKADAIGYARAMKEILDLIE